MSVTFDQRKKELRMYWKLWKNRLIKEKDIPPHIKEIMPDYYPVTFKKEKEKGKD